MRPAFAIATSCLLAVACAVEQPSNDPNDSNGIGQMVPGDECFESVQPTAGSFLEIQRLATADGSVALWYSREPDLHHVDRPGADARGNTQPFLLTRVWIDSSDEEGTCVRDSSAMTYAFMHHNWDDTWTVTTPHARYIGREVWDFAAVEDASWTFTLEARDASGATLFGPVELIERGCESRPELVGMCPYRVPLDAALMQQSEGEP